MLRTATWGFDSFRRWRRCADSPSHGRGQGFKSPHLHPIGAQVTGLRVGSSRGEWCTDPASCRFSDAHSVAAIADREDVSAARSDPDHALENRGS
jgi:hypothetical protein